MNRFNTDSDQRQGGSHFKNSGSEVKKAENLVKFNENDFNNADKKRNNKKIAIVIVLILVALLLTAGIALALYIHNLQSNIQRNISEQEIKEINQQVVPIPKDENQTYYILLLGSDARPGDTTSRSDAMILTRLDPKNKTVVLISIPRDLKVELEGHGTQKINVAYAFDGPSGAIKAVSDFSGVPISAYMEIDFQGLVELVDTLGGIEVEIPVEFTGPNGSNEYHFNAGIQKLDGDETLAFSRERYSFVRGDFQRAENQRNIIKAIAKKVLSAPVTDIPGLVSTMSKNITTNLSINELVDIALTFKEMKSNDLHSYGVPSYSQTENGISYVISNDDEWQQMINAINEGQTP